MKAVLRLLAALRTAKRRRCLSEKITMRFDFRIDHRNIARIRAPARYAKEILLAALHVECRPPRIAVACPATMTLVEFDFSFSVVRMRDIDGYPTQNSRSGTIDTV